MNLFAMDQEHCWNAFFADIALTTKLLTINKHQQTVKSANLVIVREAALNKLIDDLMRA